MATVGRKKGGPKTGGRQKGTPNKYTLSMKDAVLETFAQLGEVKHMVAWATENPSDFYRIAAKLIPTQIEADVKHTKENADGLADAMLADIATGGRYTPVRATKSTDKPN